MRGADQPKEKDGICSTSLTHSKLSLATYSQREHFTQSERERRYESDEESPEQVSWPGHSSADCPVYAQPLQAVVLSFSEHERGALSTEQID